MQYNKQVYIRLKQLTDWRINQLFCRISVSVISKQKCHGLSGSSFPNGINQFICRSISELHSFSSLGLQLNIFGWMKTIDLKQPPWVRGNCDLLYICIHLFLHFKGPISWIIQQKNPKKTRLKSKPNFQSIQKKNSHYLRPEPLLQNTWISPIAPTGQLGDGW